MLRQFVVTDSSYGGSVFIGLNTNQVPVDKVS